MSGSDQVLYQETQTRFLILRLEVTVTENGVSFRLSPIPRTFTLPARLIDDVRVAPYSSRTYGGWHWGYNKTSNGNTVYRLRGSRGVEIIRMDGTRTFVGTRNPEGLRDAISQITESASDNDS